jgi:predicted RNA-binding protein with PIN domain
VRHPGGDVAVPEPTLYLFDGHNLLHAGGFAEPRAFVDRLADFVAVRGARGVVVFDGAGADADLGPLAVRYAPDADALLERLAVEARRRETVCLVSSDRAVRGTAGQEVRKLRAADFLAGLEQVEHREPETYRIAERVDDETRARLERLRRGED